MKSLPILPLAMQWARNCLLHLLGDAFPFPLPSLFALLRSKGPRSGVGGSTSWASVSVHFRSYSTKNWCVRPCNTISFCLEALSWDFVTEILPDVLFHLCEEMPGSWRRKAKELPNYQHIRHAMEPKDRPRWDRK